MSDDPVTNDDFSLPDLRTASEVWRFRADQLWSLAEQSGDLRAMAQSLQAGLKSLSDWATQLEQQQNSTAMAMSQTEKDRVIREDSGAILAKVDAYISDFALVSCPGCTNTANHRSIGGYTTNERAQQLTKLLKGEKTDVTNDDSTSTSTN